MSDGMPRPFARLSAFGQLYTALDGWVTRASLDFVQARCSVAERSDRASRPYALLPTQ